MIEHLLALSTNDLRDIALALRSARLSFPFSSLGVQRVVQGDAAGIAVGLQRLADAGLNEGHIASTLELIVRDRQSRPRMEDQLDLVTTGPDVCGITNRDTAVVVREMFATAKRSVIVAGYAVYQGQHVFQALADQMASNPNLDVRLFLDIKRPAGDPTAESELVRRFAHRLRTQQWPKDRPCPPIYFDPRSIGTSGEQRACLHAKCVVVDHHDVFISSANLTEAAQRRNIEVGVLIRSTALAERITLFFDTLVAAGSLSPISQ